MSVTDEDDYGDIADEDLIDVLSSQPSQTLPQLHDSSPRASEDEITEDDEPAQRKTAKNRRVTPGDEEGEGDVQSKKKKYRIHICTKEAPPARIIGATQADQLPDSSPYRIRGAIYRQPRPEPPPRPPNVSQTPRYVPPRGKPPRHQDSLTRIPSIADDEAFARSLQEVPPSKASFSRVSSIAEDAVFARELQDLPENAFDSSPDTAFGSKQAISIGSSPDSQLTQPRNRLVAPQNGLRQTTLFGGRAPQEVHASQAKKVFNYKVDKPPEPPTHHVLDVDALKTWIYPMNLGAIRDYQYNIVRNGLFNNTLVALPTGLGKTFIAATIMFNYFRWTKDAQIVFVAPTKPLVAQQVSACYGIVAIPRSETTMLTGDQPPGLRAEEWVSKRVFFMTPQTLMNDLSSGIADPKKIVLLVVDEAHRATGNYSYVQVVQFIRRFNTSFRILALTATPGSSVEGVQEVIDGLEISKVEIRTEESIDIQQYTHRRDTDQIILDPSDEIIMIKELFSKTLKPLVDKLCSNNGYWNKDPMALTTFGMLQARKSWMTSETGKHAAQPLKNMMNALFSILASISHGIRLLNFHGIGPFYMSIKDFRDTAAEGKSKYKQQILESPDFRKMMSTIQSWLNKEDFIGHPKLTYLCDTILNHFLDAGEGRLPEGAPPSSTRVIVFSEFRESAEDITRVLNRHGPMIRASVFVGQADSKRSQGMNQQAQEEAIRKFKKGIFNVIVATSIGEEGLDIGSVDLIVCYDASASPIRMLQRMGRTGRKRAGKIVLLLMRGKEESSFAKAKDNYEQMQKLIANGDKFAFRSDLSTRIIPKDVVPVVDKVVIDIPPENSQNSALPIPKKGDKTRKKPPKKYHMPDGVETGFKKASKLRVVGGGLVDMGITSKPKRAANIELVDIPKLESVLLNSEEILDLESRFLNVAGTGYQEVEMPDITAQTAAQRALLPIVNVPHGSYTKRCVRLFKTLANSQNCEDRYTEPYGSEPIDISWTQPPLVEDNDIADSDVSNVQLPKSKNAAPAKRKQTSKQKRPLGLPEEDTEQEHTMMPPTKRQQVRNPVFSMSIEESDGDEGEGGPPSSEGPGDLIHSEALSADESDVGSLADFLADGQTQFSILSSSPPPTTRSILGRLVEPSQTQITMTQGTDDFPDLDELLGKNATSSSQVALDDLDSEMEENVAPVMKRKRRRVVEEDSDE